MEQYLDLLNATLQQGIRKPTRAVLASTGQHVEALSIFGYQMRFDLSVGFPAVTTKRLPWAPIVHELIWFLSGSTNIRYLREHNVKIWDQWADEDGELGPIYGRQWRSWVAPNGQTVDQIAYVLEGIAAVQANPTATVGRRLIVTAWNPADTASMALPACHTLFQFSVTQGRLSCQLYQRSADLFLGVPFNVASYALLTHLVARVSGLGVGEFIHTFGDAHIYENHVEAVREQLRRQPLPLPRLELDPSITSLEALRIEQIRLIDYCSHPPLRGEVAV